MPLRYDEIQEVRSIVKEEIERAIMKKEKDTPTLDGAAKWPATPTGASKGSPSGGGFLTQPSTKEGGKKR